MNENKNEMRKSKTHHGIEACVIFHRNFRWSMNLYPAIDFWCTMMPLYGLSLCVYHFVWLCRYSHFIRKKVLSCVYLINNCDKYCVSSSSSSPMNRTHHNKEKYEVLVWSEDRDRTWNVNVFRLLAIQLRQLRFCVLACV